MLLISNKDSHVLLFTGQKGVGKKIFARSFAAALLGERHSKKVLADMHPDVIWLKPEGKLYMHSIASIEQMTGEASLSPFEATKKIYILDDADRMLPFSSNALLKILEEPPSHVSFILLTAHEELVLPTITSRCSKIPFFPISEEEIAQKLIEQGKDEEEAKNTALLSQGSFSLALKLLEKSEDPVHVYTLSLLRSFFLTSSSASFLEMLESIEKLCDADEEEGKVVYAVERILEDIFYWLRDLHYRRVDPNAKHLFFQKEHPQIPEKLPSLESAFLFLEEAKVALQRSIRPKIVLERLLNRLVIASRV
jgi:DNA polymerase-3 subunit delta'